MLLEQLLAEQQELTAVEQFAEFSDSDARQDTDCVGRYAALLPASPPAEGEQYAFAVDLDRCSGCKACVTACHSLNGLDDDEAWRDVGLLQGGTTDLPVLQHVTTACHHCLEPACLTACPVDAYEKNPLTGIVKHLDDQCIGCRYCTLACPYDVPKYNRSRGIVRKCDMCSERLTAGEAPACVQACPGQAISIDVVARDDVVRDAEAHPFLPGAPDPAFTLPTTSYKTDRVLPRNTLPADYYAVHREHAHWPLVVMLVLTQLSVGAFFVELVLAQFLSGTQVESIRPVHSASALIFGLLALGASLLHLGRPQYAFRAVIGLKHSWLSREILAFGLFAALAAGYSALNWLSPSGASFFGVGFYLNGLGWAVVLAGLAGLYCSVMVYAFTRRVVWSGVRTGVKFLLTTALLGVATAWLTLMLVSLGAGLSESGSIPTVRQVAVEYGPPLCQCLMLAALLKLSFEAAAFRHLVSKRNTPMKRSARLMAGELSSATLARFSLGLLGGVFMPGFLYFGLEAGPRVAVRSAGDLFLTVAVVMLFAACLAGELLERYLFFTAAQAPRMPGDFIS